MVREEVEEEAEEEKKEEVFDEEKDAYEAWEFREEFLRETESPSGPSLPIKSS